ncbi:LysR family transcriptional regulator [Qipengyuania seohaensis]|uniref:LysR family transcriptional regulator n=1 Tax=Qipengyuania seohaensis TaxID=266951 RepID=UPI000C22505C|nr:LysR family transcriptional regulator [Qipengyuania seohaensis]
MRLRQIEIFYHVYRTGSISAAARDLNVSQPSVSKVLSHAEDRLGFALFMRRKGRLIPTAAADELFIEAEDIYARLSTFNRSLENIRSRKGGHLRLGVLPSLSLSVGPELVARMREDDPDLSFELTTLHSVEIEAALREKRVDMCIGFEPVDDPRLLNHRVGDGRMVIVSGEPLAGSRSDISEQVLHEAEMIGISESGPLGVMIRQQLEDRGIMPREVAMAHTYHVALSLVRKQVGLALIDQFTAYSHLGAGLQRYRLDDFPGYSIYAITLADHPDEAKVSPAVDALRDVVAIIGDGIESLQPKEP